MNLYKKYIVPLLLNSAMGSADFGDTRTKVVGNVRGRVLEIGFGSGYNLPFYKGVEHLYALEPSQKLYEYALPKIKEATFAVEHLAQSAEAIPLADNSMDAVVSTWTLCSVSDMPKVLSEMYRVLKPGGSFFFVEHGISPRPLIAAAQKLTTPVTKVFTGNCHLDRVIDKAITQAGFVTKELHMSPEKGRPLMFSYRGIAIKSSID